MSCLTSVGAGSDADARRVAPHLTPPAARAQQQAAPKCRRLHLLPPVAPHACIPEDKGASVSCSCSSDTCNLSEAKLPRPMYDSVLPALALAGRWRWQARSLLALAAAARRGASHAAARRAARRAWRCSASSLTRDLHAPPLPRPTHPARRAASSPQSNTRPPPPPPRRAARRSQTAVEQTSAGALQPRCVAWRSEPSPSHRTALAATRAPATRPASSSAAAAAVASDASRCRTPPRLPRAPSARACCLSAACRLLVPCPHRARRRALLRRRPTPLRRQPACQASRSMCSRRSAASTSSACKVWCR